MITAADKSYDIERVRADFPILSVRTASGRPLAYLDSAATSQKPKIVIDAVSHFYAAQNANVHRGIYELAQGATAAYEAARISVARLIGAPDPACLVFVRNATEAINLVAYAWGRANLGPGDLMLTSEMEHHANLVPWQQLCAATEARLAYIPVIESTGSLDLGAFERLLIQEPKLVAVSAASNMLGTINPLIALIERAHAAGALTLVDGAQAVPSLPVDVLALGADFYAFSGHKALGPTGSGVLWGRRALLEAMPPFLTGGDMIRSVTLDSATWNEIPGKFEAGTPDAAGAVGLGVAAEYLLDLGMEALAAHESALTASLLDAFTCDFPEIKVYGPRDPADRVGLVSFNVAYAHPHDVAQVLDSVGVAVRAGHHCTMPLHAKLGLDASVRASFGPYSDQSDVEALLMGLREVRRMFRGAS